MDGFARLEALFDSQRRDDLAALRAEPGAVGVDTVLGELVKLSVLTSFVVSPAVFDGIDQRVVGRWHDRFAASRPSALAAMPASIRVTLTAAWVLCRRRRVIDGIVDLLIAVVHKIGARAERRVEREQLADVRRVSGQTTVLFRLAEAALANPDGIVSEVLFPVVGEDTLRDLVRHHELSGPALRGQVQTFLRASYSRHYRRIMPELLAALTFRSSNTTHRPVLDAIEILRRYVGRNERLFPINEHVPLDGVVPVSWRGFVTVIDSDGKERGNRIAYEICVLQALRDRLRCKEIWVDGAQRWRNPDDDLPKDFDVHRPRH